MGHRINKPLITDKNQEEDIVENLDLEILEKMKGFHQIHLLKNDSL